MLFYRKMLVQMQVLYLLGVVAGDGMEETKPHSEGERGAREH